MEEKKDAVLPELGNLKVLNTAHFFVSGLTLQGRKIDPQVAQTITEIKTPQCFQDLQSYLSYENILRPIASELSHLTALLRAKCKIGIAFAWESSQQEAFDSIKKETTREYRKRP